MSGQREGRHQANSPQKESAGSKTTIDQMAQTEKPRQEDRRLTERQADREKDK